MSKTLSKFSPEVRDRAVRMVFSHESDYLSRWAAIVSISGKIGCVLALPKLKGSILYEGSCRSLVHHCA